MKPSKKSDAAAAPEQSELNLRKREHIRVCLEDGVDLGRDSLAGHKLRYNALPGIALKEVSTKLTFAGRAAAAPLIISSMTGGVGEAFERINRNLALGAQELGLPLGLGSMKILLNHPEARAGFEVRRFAPEAIIIANLGLASFNHGLGYEDVERVMEIVRPDVFGFHLNALQEAIQEGGDTDFRELLVWLERLAAKCPLPIYVKECGGGIAPELVQRLIDAGADYVDVSGADGTSWAAVEGKLSQDPTLGELFSDFGLSTAWILERLGPELRRSGKVVAGGGIRNGLQAVKAMALGAGQVTMARPFLLAARESPEAVVALGQRVITEMRTAMFLAGAKELAALDRSLLLDPPPGP